MIRPDEINKYNHGACDDTCSEELRRTLTALSARAGQQLDIFPGHRSKVTKRLTIMSYIDGKGKGTKFRCVHCISGHVYLFRTPSTTLPFNELIKIYVLQPCPGSLFCPRH